MNTITQQKLHEILASKKLDYTVDTVNITDPFTNEPSKFFGTYRTDTKEIFTMSLSKQFAPIQNIDAFKFLTELSNTTNIDIAQGGVFNGGASVYLQLALGKSDIGGGDMVGNYLTVVNSHDGSRAMTIMLTPYRFFCKNQIAPAFRNASKQEDDGKQVRILMRHTAGASIAMEQMTKTIAIANDQFEFSVNQYKKLANTKVTSDTVSKVVAKMFPMPESIDAKRANTIWHTNVENVKSRFYSADNGQIEQWTAWNLYNAIQGTLQHDARKSTKLEQSILMGKIAEKSSHALSLVSEMVGA